MLKSGIGEGAGPLLQNRLHHVVIRVAELFASVKQGQEPASVNSALAVDEYRARVRLANELVHHFFKLCELMGDVHVERIYGVQAMVFVRT